MRVLLLCCVALAVAVAVAGAAAHDRYHPEKAVNVKSRASRNENTAEYWAAEALAGIEKRLRERARRRQARNVVMFLGDGMSVPTLAAARTLLGQRRQETGEEAQLSFEDFPTTGLSKTYCLDAQIADSACTATAYLCGVKGNYGTIGVNGAVPRYDCAASAQPGVNVDSIAAWALRDGRDAGIVTTTRITHASPAGTFANTANRGWENNAHVAAAGHDPALCPDIAHQLINQYPGNEFKVILGGGRREFITTNTVDEEGELGLRTDGRNLIEEWESRKESIGASYNYVWNRDQLLELASSPPDYLLELTEVAIRSLMRNDKGFFLFVESGRIDHAHHDTLPHLALDETIAMSEAIDKAMELLSEEDSLIVVTADHAHVMAFNGYSPRGHDILGPSRDVDDDNVPYMTLSYTNGPGARKQVDGIRPNVLLDSNFGELTWETHAEIPLDSETHGGDDVGVFAWGPHHDMFSGVYEQSQIPHLMAYAACFGPGKHACEADNGDNGDGDNGNGDNGNDDNGNGDNGSGDNGNGDNGNGDNGNGDNGNGDNDNGAATISSTSILTLVIIAVVSIAEQLS